MNWHSSKGLHFWFPHGFLCLARLCITATECKPRAPGVCTVVGDTSLPLVSVGVIPKSAWIYSPHKQAWKKSFFLCLALKAFQPAIGTPTYKRSAGWKNPTNWKGTRQDTLIHSRVSLKKCLLPSLLLVDCEVIFFSQANVVLHLCFLSLPLQIFIFSTKKKYSTLFLPIIVYLPISVGHHLASSSFLH